MPRAEICSRCESYAKEFGQKPSCQMISVVQNLEVQTSPENMSHILSTNNVFQTTCTRPATLEAEIIRIGIVIRPQQPIEKRSARTHSQSTARPIRPEPRENGNSPEISLQDFYDLHKEEPNQPMHRISGWKIVPPVVVHTLAKLVEVRSAYPAKEFSSLPPEFVESLKTELDEACQKIGCSPNVKKQAFKLLNRIEKEWLNYRSR